MDGNLIIFNYSSLVKPALCLSPVDQLVLN
jgi:hypothetical protein